MFHPRGCSMECIRSFLQSDLHQHLAVKGQTFDSGALLEAIGGVRAFVKS